MKTKICSKCKRELFIIDFSIDKTRLDGLRYWCKQCWKQYQKTYYQKHKEKILFICKKYRIKNKIKIAIKDKKRRKIYYKNNSKKLIKHIVNNTREKLNNDVNFRLIFYLRNRLRLALKGNPKFSTTMKLVGCSIDLLKLHLQSKFQLGMTWDNYGKWHIDHIIPCARFDLSKASEQRKCFNYTNLQPLWAKENLSKNKY